MWDCSTGWNISELKLYISVNFDSHGRSQEAKLSVIFGIDCAGLSKASTQNTYTGMNRIDKHIEGMKKDVQNA